MTALDCWQCCHFVVALQFEPSLNKDFERFPPQSIKIVPSKQILCRFLKFILSLIIIIYMIWFWSPLGHKSASLYSNLWAERAIVRGHQGSELRKVDGEKHKCSTFHAAPSTLLNGMNSFRPIALWVKPLRNLEFKDLARWVPPPSFLVEMIFSDTKYLRTIVGQFHFLSNMWYEMRWTIWYHIL